MTNICISINEMSLNDSQIDEFNQIICIQGTKYRLFEALYKDWNMVIESNFEKANGYYHFVFSTDRDMVLDEIKRWTSKESRSHRNYLNGCRLHVYYTNHSKYGYYQIADGRNEIGFSLLRNRPDLVNQLMTDINHPDFGLKDNFYRAITLRHAFLEDPEGYDGDVSNSPESKLIEPDHFGNNGRKVYSLFTSSKDFKKTQLMSATNTLKNLQTEGGEIRTLHSIC